MEVSLRTGVRRDVGDGVVVLVDVDGGEDDPACLPAEVAVGVGELGGHDRADVGAVRVHELQHHDLAAEGGQRQDPAVLVGQREARRGPDRHW